MGLTRAEVEHVARLAGLALGDAEVERFTRELDVVLDYVRVLEGLDVADVPPTTHVLALAAPLREDVVQPGLGTDEALGGAPERRADLFAVPKAF